MSLFIIPSLKSKGGAETIVEILSKHLNFNVLAWKDTDVRKILCELGRNRCVITFLESSLVFGFLAKYVFGAKWIHSIRNDYGFIGIKGMIYRYLMNQADLIVLTAHGQEWMVGKRQKWCVIYNPSDGYQFVDVHRQYDFIGVSSLTEKKGILDLVSFWNMFSTDLRIAYIGNGPLINEIVKLKRESIEMMGFLDSKKKVREILSSSKFFFLNSVKEGSPNALLEAWDCGCFVVVRDFKYGPREYFLGQKNYETKLTYPVIDFKKGYVIYGDLSDLKGLDWSELWKRFTIYKQCRLPLTQTHSSFLNEWQKISTS